MQGKTGELTSPPLGRPLGPALLQTNSQSLEGERRRVTILFADIVGFTTLAEAMDPEHAHSLVNGCFEQLVPAVIRCGGKVDKFIGDEIMALFGAPIAHENDPERALRCAISMQEALAEFNAVHHTQLGIHIGINTGLVVAGGIGAGDRLDYSVVGDAVNLASRLVGAARGDEILVGPDTYHDTGHLFDFQAIGPLKLKGKGRPVRAYKLLGTRAGGAGPGAPETNGIHSPLVGRYAELAMLLGCIDRLQSGQGGIVSIRAEAGIGKSRLLVEVRRQAITDQVNWLEGRAMSIGQNISYSPFLEIIQADAGITSDDSEEERWTKLERRVTELFPTETAEFLPYLARLLGLDVPGPLAERVKYLDGDAMGRQIFRSARHFFARLAEERPLVLVFEDMHWADESSMLLLEHLGPLVRDLPVLICGTARLDPDVPASRLLKTAAEDYGSYYTDIRLEPMSDAESSQLVQNLLGNIDLSPKLRDGILRKAEGNPFFVEEIVRALIDFGGLQRDKATGHWQVTAQAEQIEIPATLQGVIMARIDRLDEDARQVAKLASVIGRSFLYRLLLALGEAGGTLDLELQELKHLQIIREKSRTPELEYIFKHALVQAATYESILLQRRQVLHKRVGECIETLFADRLDEFHSLLAYHFTLAEEWAKAQHYLLKAGDQAGMLAADGEALTHYRRATEAYERAFGDTWDPVQRAALERKIGEALLRRGDTEEARVHLERALGFLGKSYPNSRLGVRIAMGKELVRQAGHRLKGLFSPSGKPGRVDQAKAEELCRIYYALTWIDFFLDLERHALDEIVILNLAERAGLQTYVAVGASGVGASFDAMGMHRAARLYERFAVRTAERAQQPEAVGQAYLDLAAHYHYATGQWEKALECYERSIKACSQAGIVRAIWSASTALRGRLLAQQGDFDGSLKVCRDLIRVGEETADRQGWGWGHWSLGSTLHEAGNLEEAVYSLRQAIDSLLTIPDYLSAAGASAYLARAYMRQGKLAEAGAVLEKSREWIVTRGLAGWLIAPVWAALAELRLILAEQTEASRRDTPMKAARQACQMALKWGRLDRASLVAAYRAKGTYEWLAGSPTAAHWWWQRSLQLARRLGARYELGMTHLEIGRLTGEHDRLESAQSIFANVGAQFDLAQTQGLLRRQRLQQLLSSV